MTMQATVVQTMDSDLSNGSRYPLFEELRSGLKVLACVPQNSPSILTFINDYVLQKTAKKPVLNE